jgi:hypothetical protein
MSDRSKDQLGIAELAQRSGFIFQGTVEKLGSATMSIVPVTDSTIVVKVDEVFRSAQTLGDVTGKDITVQLTAPQKTHVGNKLIFFTESWLYGDSIAVLEVGRFQVEKDNAPLHTKIKNEIQKLPDNELQKRIVHAEIIVVGKVLKSQPAVLRWPSRMTEHDPDWWETNVGIQSLEKGTYSEKTIAVYFPHSIDIMWYETPKFHIGQEGIWLLHKSQIEEINAESFTALDPMDFQPKQKLERIRTLVRQLGVA